MAITTTTISMTALNRNNVLRIWLALFLIFNNISNIDAQVCPNSCSGQGRCVNPGMVCICFAGYTGGDCSLRLCPFDSAWVDIAQGVDDAHNSAECSNMGVCDRLTGLCTCRTGFSGKACERQVCPGSTPCNDVGKCQSMKYHAATKNKGMGVTTYPPSSGITSVYTYSNIWDATKIFGCQCDEHYTGSDCSLQNCPVGDDPLTGNGVNTLTNPVQVNEIQKVSCKAGGGTFTLSYDGATTLPIPYNAKGPDLVSYLSSLTTLNSGPYAVTTTVMFDTQACLDAGATFPACLDAGTAFTIEFLRNFGNLDLVVSDSTNLFFKDSLSTPYVVINKLRAGTKENAYCSNRGICDPTTGYCTCNTNYDTSDGYASAGTRGDCGYPTLAIATCPGLISCSAHGQCAGSPTYYCACSAGWTGSDCSERLCPTSVAWFGYPTAIDTAHVSESVECGNQGVCDRSTGVCGCSTGFTGESCEYLSCPGVSVSCNAHGECLDMTSLAGLASINGDAAYYTYGVTPNNPITWDGSKIYGCSCDATYGGYDCSERTCPFGDDPSTLQQYDESQIITCTDSNLLGSVFLLFRQQVTVALAATATYSQIKTAFQALSTIGIVNVESLQTNSSGTLCSKTGTSILVTFLTNHGDLPLITVSSNVGIDSISIAENVKGTKENEECSGRGLCNRLDGICACFSGYGSSNGMGGIGVNGDCGFLEPYVYTTV